jgi:signal transduction histidine kinase
MKFDQLISYFSQCQDAFWVFSEDLELIFANGATHKLTGWSPDKFQGCHWRDLNAALQKICAENHSGIFSENRPPDGPAIDTVQLISPKPRMISRHVNRIAVTDKTNRDHPLESFIYVMSFRDLTRELNIEVAKSNFLSTAAHELRTPMSSVLGFTELLLNNSYSKERTIKTLGIIHRHAARTVDLINELLDLSRIESERGMDFMLERFSLHDQIMIVISGLSPSHRQRVVIDNPLKDYWVKIDESKFQMALLNILSNALKYSGGDKPVNVRIRENIEQEKIMVGVEIRDQGIGIKPEDMPKLFTRFFRSDVTNSISGTGLGLHIVQEIMNQLDGSIIIDSQYGQGTQATLWLPLEGDQSK